MALDLDAVRAGACHPDCATIYAPYRRHAPECRADDILELVDELERLRAAVALHREDRVGAVVASWCVECEKPWPCPTVRTAEGGGDG